MIYIISITNIMLSVVIAISLLNANNTLIDKSDNNPAHILDVSKGLSYSNIAWATSVIISIVILTRSFIGIRMGIKVILFLIYCIIRGILQEIEPRDNARKE